MCALEQSKKIETVTPKDNGLSWWLVAADQQLVAAANAFAAVAAAPVAVTATTTVTKNEHGSSLSLEVAVSRHSKDGAVCNGSLQMLRQNLSGSQGKSLTGSMGRNPDSSDASRRGLGRLCLLV